ncbi:hypothetical protein [Martelella mediterranea]|uniref:Uncharacterized protein n=1 Tax=Martelella mediterranea DSM 17316 TaxID=1122214 RepID=A0A1U9Z2J7_9HYPH|nr:hypothetical protein [Martelella mediterranea]AQZ51906.1 hypothetical protein Mame_02580 [Martelella mediterranea DSM 17316]
MIYASQAIIAALENAAENGLSERKLVYVHARDRVTGLVSGMGVWAGDEDLSITVASGLTGAAETRAYYGGGTLIDVGNIVCATDMTIRPLTIKLSQIADVAQALLRTLDIRLARVEVHTLYLDPATGAMIGSLLDFVGEVDKAPLSTPAAGDEGAIALTCVPDLMSMLTRINPRKSSYEDQKAHANGDEWSLYASTAGDWTIWWGQKGE